MLWVVVFFVVGLVMVLIEGGVWCGSKTTKPARVCYRSGLCSVLRMVPFESDVRRAPAGTTTADTGTVGLVSKGHHWTHGKNRDWKVK